MIFKLFRGKHAVDERVQLINVGSATHLHCAGSAARRQRDRMTFPFALRFLRLLLSS